MHLLPAGVAEDGSLALLDVTQAVEAQPSYRARQRRLRQLLSAPWVGGKLCSRMTA
jgi:hypothetical protein